MVYKLHIVLNLLGLSFHSLLFRSSYSVSFHENDTLEWKSIYDRLSNAIVTTEFETLPLDIEKTIGEIRLKLHKREALSRIPPLFRMRAKNHAAR